MKKILSVMILLVATASLGASRECYEAVLKDKALQGATILGINRTQVYRCLDCYDFEVTVRKDSGESVLKFMTERSFLGPATGATINVTRK